MPALRASRSLLAAQLIFVACALWFASVALARQWSEVGTSLRTLRPDWALVVASAAPVLLAYAVLVETWRFTLRSWSAGLPYLEAARISFISNLGRYVPGKVWQIAAMGVMAKQRGVSPVAATASSLLVNAVNVVSGFAIALLTGARALDVRGPSARPVALGLVLAAALGLAASPFVLPRLAELAGRITGRPISLPAVPARAILAAAAGTAVAWVLYGLAFQSLAFSLFGEAPGAPALYVAAYTVSYLVGYLALFAPGGLVVREAMLVAALVGLGLMAQGPAWLLALASRLWLTVLEVLPGALFLAHDALRRRPRNTFA